MASTSANKQLYYELYRRSSIGMQLTDALDELIQSGHINPVLAMRVLNEFDKAIATNLAKNVKAKSQLKGHLKDYRLCEEVWTFRVRNATLKLDNAEILDVDKVKIVACKMADSTTK
ncbi:putative transcription initiation factor iia gamma chain [Mycosarcoma maydis]|uniref:Transcription initiation factor IIA subunit 2 n=1 Tax=Mycosarcoma maydis TaxID=5270 RepID=A0A0D1CN82_MYCMD|nr:putative transcription initiation factor iia gamma chain [Ustilago maydis 521]KIS68093.1 putative transcription initiation factor iia gamma chain [Ustilago maydis 521]|eukprot:XP_011390306.1 putative transcription initiation factor iia gamma chain [Ustilago maydis 521]